MTPDAVLDASAVLAWLQREPGSEIVDPLLGNAVMSAVNWCEVLQKVVQKQRDPEEVGGLLANLGVVVVPLTERDALAAARLWSRGPALSLADRCCLALAARLEVAAVTADCIWQTVASAQEVVVIR